MIAESAYIHPCVVIGKNVKIGPNCSIGYEGFTFPRDEDGIPRFVEHKGGVVIGDNVELQANVAISRGILESDNTTIGKDSKLDNLVHVGHNTKIGEGNVIAAGTVFSGNVVTGKNNFFGVNSMLIAGCMIGSYNLIGIGSVVITSIPDHEVWAGNPARKLRDNLMFKKYWKEHDEKKRELEENSGSYIEFYKKFMDFRVDHDPKTAIGNIPWEKVGCSQLRFLQDMGLEQYHSLLDIGCGTLSLGNVAIPYLTIGNYVGTDISGEALEAGRRLVGMDVIGEKRVSLFQTCDFSFREFRRSRRFDYVMAYSVFNHLPLEHFGEFCSNVKSITHSLSKIFVTVILSSTTGGVDTKPYTNFHYSENNMKEILDLQNLTMEIVDVEKYGLRVHGQMNSSFLETVQIKHV